MWQKRGGQYSSTPKVQPVVVVVVVVSKPQMTMETINILIGCKIQVKLELTAFPLI